jgi:hypothetical protein
MTHTRRQLALLAACLGVPALAGCVGATQPAAGCQASAATSQPASSASAGPSPQGVNVAAFDALAKQEASAWPQSPLGKVWKTGLVIPAADDLTGGPVRGFSSDGAREAFGNGNLVYTGPPPSGAPPGHITWADGSTTKVPLLSEAQVFTGLKNNAWGRFPGCKTTALAVTGAQPTTMAVSTSRGTASVPAWAFTVSEANGPVFQAAIPPGSYLLEDSVRQPAADLGLLGKAFAGVAEAGLSGDGGRTLEMMLGGAPCNPAATRGGLVAEVGDVVVAGGWIRDPRPGAACPANLIGSDVTVRLAAPLGDRVILDAATGLPVAPVPFQGSPVTAR